MAQDKNLLTVILVCCLLVVSIVALVIGIVSLNSQSGGGGGRRTNTTDAQQPINIYTQPSNTGINEDRVWLFAIGHYDNILEYLDERTYTIKGFGPDIIDAVCSIANKNCKLVNDIYENCWDSQAGERPRGGQGLMGGWYDACTGWVQSFDRLLTYYFTVPYKKGNTVALFAKTDSTVTYNDLTNRKVGFLDGWSADEFCLARYTNIAGSMLGTNQIFHYQSADHMIDAILNDQIDVAFGTALAQFTTSLKRISPYPGFENNCEAGGSSMMTRHTSRDLVNWWNDAYQRLVDRGRYNEICEAVHERHGHIPGQTYEEICLGY